MLKKSGIVLLVALLMTAGAQMRFVLGEVPITLQSLVLYASGLLLNWQTAFLSQLLYLALGLFLPVFAGDGHGISYLISSKSSGYLLSFPLVAMVIAVISTRYRFPLSRWVAIQCGSVVLFCCGVVWLHFAAGHATWLESFQTGWFSMILIDQAKILGALILCDILLRLFPQIYLLKTR